MSKSKRVKYSAQFRADAFELVISSSRLIVDCLEDLGINEGTLGNWIRKWREEHPEANRRGWSLAALPVLECVVGCRLAAWRPGL